MNGASNSRRSHLPLRPRRARRHLWDHWGERYAGWTYSGRWWIVTLWLVVAAATVLVPPPRAAQDETASLIPLDSPAIQTEKRAFEVFGFPLSSRTSVVQRDPAGLDPFVQAESVLDAIATVQQPQPWPLLGALPFPNALPFGGRHEQNTAILTYLFMDPVSSFASQEEAAQRYVARELGRPEDRVIGVVGSVPARAEQGALLADNLPKLEILTLVAIILLVGVSFRSVVVPLVALGAAGLAVAVTLWCTAAAAALFRVGAPVELKPLLVALLLGVVTDYTIFYVTGYLAALGRGDLGRREQVTRAIVSYTHIIVAAGATVAAGTLTLLVARSGFFRAFGPAMALTIFVGLMVSVTLVPALLAILGPKMLWPRRPVPRVHPTDSQPNHSSGPGTPRRFSVVHALTRPPVAAAALALCVAALLIASLPLGRMTLGAKFSSSLPEGNRVAVATQAAAAGYAPGITSPTTLLLELEGITREPTKLRRLQEAIEAYPGVAGVIGPVQAVTERNVGVVLAKGGNAARMMIILDSPPLDATAIRTLSRLEDDLPGISTKVGLQDASLGLAGDTALAAGLVDSTLSDLGRIALASLTVNLLLLILFLRALVAPVYLLLCSVLALTASLGLTSWVFLELLGDDGVTFYVPFAAAVLLVSLGSDYNIFGVGRVWDEARRRPLRDAITTAVPESSRAITTAGLALAVSFGMLAVIPLTAFRELAFAMGVGILIDAFVVRSIMVPALLALIGRYSAWPGRLGPRPQAPPVRNL